MFVAVRFNEVTGTTMRVKGAPQRLHSTCSICLEERRTVELESFHSSHRKHLACRSCLDLYIVSTNSSVVKCPICRVPVDIVLYLPFS